MTTIFGTDLADNLNGDLLANTIFGLLGDDSIEGFAGDDTIFGNQGEDTIKGQDGNNVMFGGQGNDVIFGGNALTFGVDPEDGYNDLIYGNLGSDNLEGSIGDDTIFGGQDRDFILGNDGNDRIFGDLGDDRISGAGSFNTGSDDIDTLTGGPGADVFDLGDAGGTYYSASGNNDYALITDFNSSEGDNITLRTGNNGFNVQNITLPDLGTGTGIFLIIDGQFELNSFLQGVDANSLNIPERLFSSSNSTIFGIISVIV